MTRGRGHIGDRRGRSDARETRDADRVISPDEARELTARIMRKLGRNRKKTFVPKTVPRRRP